MTPTFGPRADPLPARAVVGVGPVAHALATRLLARPDDDLRHVDVLVADALFIALAPAEALPWADGAVYLGSDPRAPALLMPTTLAPPVHPQLFERALRRLEGAHDGPLAVWPGQVVPLKGAAPPSRARLLAWVAR